LHFLNNVIRKCAFGVSSGLISGLAVVLLSLREQVGEFMFIYVAQLLMLIGNAGRIIALRMYLPERLGPALIVHTVAAVCYFLWITSAYEAGTSDAATRDDVLWFLFLNLHRLFPSGLRRIPTTGYAGPTTVNDRWANTFPLSRI
jgi:hypothetical protein